MHRFTDRYIHRPRTHTDMHVCADSRIRSYRFRDNDRWTQSVNTHCEGIDHPTCRSRAALHSLSLLYFKPALDTLGGPLLLIHPLTDASVGNPERDKGGNAFGEGAL